MIPNRFKSLTIVAFAFVILFMCFYGSAVVVDVRNYYSILGPESEYFSSAYVAFSIVELIVILFSIISSIVVIANTAKAKTVSDVVTFRSGSTAIIFIMFLINCIRATVVIRNYYDTAAIVTNSILIANLLGLTVFSSINESLARKGKYRLSSLLLITILPFVLGLALLLMVTVIRNGDTLSGIASVPLTVYGTLMIISSSMLIKREKKVEPKPVQKEVVEKVIEEEPIQVIKEPVVEPDDKEVDPAAKLKQLKELLDSGLITKEEYEEARKKYVAML